MIELRRVSYCALGTADLSLAEDFATRVLGLQISGRGRGRLYLKSDDRAHTLCYFDGDPEDQTTAFEVADEDDLQAAASVLTSIGHEVRAGTRDECDARHVHSMIAFKDPSGNQIELVTRPEMSSTRYHGTRDAGITGFSHVGFRSRDLEGDETFWTQIFNARVSDRIGDAPLLRIDPIHHTMALLPYPNPGLDHINHQVVGTDDVQRSLSLLRQWKVPIVFGPGRHPGSSAQFLYFSGPDNVTFEYSTGVLEIADEPLYRERQLPPNLNGVCQWGAKPAVSLPAL